MKNKIFYNWNKDDCYKWTALLIGLIFILVIWISAINFYKNNYYIEVKGSAEKIVKADVAIWPIVFEVKSNNINMLYNEISGNKNIIKDFLIEKGFEEKEISISSPEIFQDNSEQAKFRFNARVKMSVWTNNKVDLVKSSSQDVLKLLEKGVLITTDYGQGILFEYSNINDIKSELLSVAIFNAEKSARQFADNAGVMLNKLANANQGQIDITDKDPGSPEYKKLRLVGTFRYLIK